MATDRLSKRKRSTSETRIELALQVDGNGSSSVATGIPFFDHMLEAFVRHGLFDLELKAEGDLLVDYHHTVEDIGIVLGEAFKEALGDKRGIRRYGFWLLPMDDALASVAIDLSGRPALVYRVRAREVFVRDFNIQLIKEFFQGFANSCGANVHVSLSYGEEPHHIAEAIFKAFARALDMATQFDGRTGDTLPTTKGLLA